MVKISITLPNTAQITFESEEPAILHEVVGMVLRDLPRDLMQPAAAGGSGQPPVLEKSTRVAGNAVTGEQSKEPEATRRSPPVSTRRTATASATAGPDGPLARAETRPGVQPAGSEAAFIGFCHSTNPLGDMRKVVVAAEGANRFLGLESVDTEDLARLFDLAEWRRPHNFTQTLRNAAREKFRWLERIPGRAGRYAATDLGRTVTLGQ